MENITDLLKNEGTVLFKCGKILIKLLSVALAILILVLIVALIGFGGIDTVIDCLSINANSGFVNFVIGILYFVITLGLIGIPLYFCGLHFLGLHQIAKTARSIAKKISKKQKESS